MIHIACEKFHCRELHGLGSYKPLSAWGTLYPRQHLTIPRDLFLSQSCGTWSCYKHSFNKSLGRMMLTNILHAQDTPTQRASSVQLEKCSRPKDCFLHVLHPRRDHELCSLPPALWVARSTSPVSPSFSLLRVCRRSSPPLSCKPCCVLPTPLNSFIC